MAAQGYNPSAAGYPQAPYGAQYGAQTSSTTVVVQQPGAVGYKTQREWRTGLMDCFEDMGICLCGLCLPLCLACQVSSDMQESWLVPCCVPAADMALRIKWRIQEGIPGSILNDCFASACCSPCVLCQLAREIKMRKEGRL